MMTTVQSLLFYENQEKAYGAVLLPYVEDFSMLVVLPYKDADLSKFLETITIDEYKGIVQNLKETQIIVQMPIVTYPWITDLKEVLGAMGVQQLFDGADLSKLIDGGTNVPVSTIIHSAGLYINEFGTTFAEINDFGTKPNNSNLAAQNNLPKFVVDRPFVAFIRHNKSNLICFSAFVKTFPSIVTK